MRPRAYGQWSGPNNARTELLKQFWADGLSASEIADLLGEVSRNAVIGKVHRLGLAGQATASRKPRPRRTSPRRMSAGRVSAPKPVPVPLPFPVTPDRLPPAPATIVLSVPQLPSETCHWPIGDPRSAEFGFCGAKTAAGRQPYCAAHRCIGLQPQRGRA